MYITNQIHGIIRFKEANPQQGETPSSMIINVSSLGNHDLESLPCSRLIQCGAYVLTCWARSN